MDVHNEQASYPVFEILPSLVGDVIRRLMKLLRRKVFDDAPVEERR